MKCMYCGRLRDLKKMNTYNWNRHLMACKIKHNGGSQSLNRLNYFIKINKNGKYILLLYLNFTFKRNILIYRAIFVLSQTHTQHR